MSTVVMNVIEMSSSEECRNELDIFIYLFLVNFHSRCFVNFTLFLYWLRQSDRDI